MANRIEAILEGRDVQPQNSYEAALKQHVASGGGSGGGGVYVVDCTMNNSVPTSTKTAGEIFEAIESKTVVFKVADGGVVMYMPLVSASNQSGYVFTVSSGISNGTLAPLKFTTDSADGYPAFDGK